MAADSAPGDPAPADSPLSGTPLDGLLAEMRDLRLTLAADLTAAAGAAEAGADSVVADIVDADRHELARFAHVADERLLRLERLAVAGPPAPKWRRRLTIALPVAPVVGALAVSAAAAAGALPLPGGTPTRAPAAITVQASDHSQVANTFRQLVDVIGNDPSRSQVIEAAARLHRQLAALIASSPDNPGRAAEIAQLLQMEESLLLREQPPGASMLLDETRRLAARLVTVTPHLTSPTAVPTVVASVPPSKKPVHAAAPSATPKPSASPKPSHSPSSKPSPTSSPSSGGPPTFPAIPN